MVVGLALVLEGETSVRDVVEILQPLKVRDGDTACVDVHVGDDQHFLVPEDGVGSWGDGAVGSFGNDLSL